MQTVPTVQMYMARTLYTIEAGEPLKKAEDMMSKLGIRHLPVMQKEKIVGILSDRDVKLAGSIMGSESEKLPVVDVCNQNPYTVEPNTPLSVVAATMADKHYGSAIVLENRKLAGIFTTVDACRVLSDLIQVRL
jgi:acetoin utilization protein AcuB